MTDQYPSASSSLGMPAANSAGMAQRQVEYVYQHEARGVQRMMASASTAETNQARATTPTAQSKSKRPLPVNSLVLGEVRERSARLERLRVYARASARTLAIARARARSIAASRSTRFSRRTTACFSCRKPGWHSRPRLGFREQWQAGFAGAFAASQKAHQRRRHGATGAGSDLPH